MKKTGVFYGSTTGTTESVARMIANKLGISSGDVYDVSKLTADVAGSYEALILGTSTWGDGELQDDWYDGIKVLKGMDLSGKTVALFGCGDSASYSDTFCDGMGILFNELKDSGCRFIGTVPATDYTYSSSVAVTDDGCFVGLAIDDINESDKTEERITAWTETLKAELA
ncbi:flavodoxin [Bacteroides sp. CAG:1076]|nr:flavodoxin [Bacteroides sp. CAG:1076]